MYASLLTHYSKWLQVLGNVKNIIQKLFRKKSYDSRLKHLTFPGNLKFQERLINNLDAVEFIHTSELKMTSDLFGVSQVH